MIYVSIGYTIVNSNSMYGSTVLSLNEDSEQSFLLCATNDPPPSIWAAICLLTSDGEHATYILQAFNLKLD